MDFTGGHSEIVIGLIDGPVARNHPDFSGANIREIPRTLNGSCTLADNVACLHGTFVSGILSSNRRSLAPAICPGCTLVVRPIFPETTTGKGYLPSATPQELARAIVDCVKAGARVLNLSVALAQPSARNERELLESLDYAAAHGVITVVAAGNQGTLGSSAITRHSWVIPVVACDLQGRPLGLSNLGNSIGRRGLSAPGENITSLGANGKTLTFSGTSAATPFVTGALALLWSAFPAASAAEVKSAVIKVAASRRTGVVPPLLDAWAAYQTLVTTHNRG